MANRKITTFGASGAVGPSGVAGASGVVGAPGPTGTTSEYSRDTATISITPAIASGAISTGVVTMAKGWRLLNIQTSVAARVRLYNSITSRDAAGESTRLVGTDPTGPHGVLLDFTTNTANLNWPMSPTVDGYVETGGGIAVPYSVTNLTAVNNAITVTLIWIKTEL